MANGVPETDVFKAADAVLARGERPTVERVRLELGRGSPARVGQLLEQWWERLAQRLKGQASLPELPGEVAEAFAGAWRLALDHADTAAHAALVEEQNRLFAMQTSLTQERKLWEIALTEAQSNVADSATRLAHAELQLGERQALNEQLAAQIVDTRKQRDHLQAQLERQQAEIEALRIDIASAQTHIRAVEDRAHQQVDQTRQEVKTLNHDHEQRRREHTMQVSELTDQRQALQASLRIAEHTAAHQAGRIAALESAISQWRQTPAIAPKRGSRKAITTPADKVRHPRKKSTT